MSKNQPKHGGKREGAGRHLRPNPKAAPIWCGQISDEDRTFILDNLTPDERRESLIKAATKRYERIND